MKKIQKGSDFLKEWSSKYIDHIMNCYDGEFAGSILENYILKCIKSNNNIEKNKKMLPKLFGELAFIYSDSKITKNRIKNFFKDLTEILPYSDPFIVEHVSNFADIVLVYKPELLFYYLDRINENYDDTNEDNLSILSRSVIRGAMRLKVNISTVFLCIKHPWRSYYALSSYYSYFNDNNSALDCIIKAVETCPDVLIDMFRKKRENILENIAISKT
jgi:hypothetical protein